MPRISLSSIFVNDQLRARSFYTDVLDFDLGVDEAAGRDRWLTVVSDEDPTGVQLVLEPTHNPAARAQQRALFAQGIAATSLEVDDIDYEYERLIAAGVTFQSPPVDSGSVRMCLLDDTCGNWIRLTQPIDD